MAAPRKDPWRDESRLLGVASWAPFGLGEMNGAKESLDRCSLTQASRLG